MKSNIEKREFRIRPLSEGIGIGTLHSASRSVKKSAPRQVPSKVMDQNWGVARQGHAVYKTQSVEAEIRSRQSTKLFVTFMRFAAGVGTDIFVGSFSVFVLAWAGILAWEAGTTGTWNPLASVLAITDALEAISPLKVVVAVVTLAIVWRTSRMLLAPQPSVR